MSILRIENLNAFHGLLPAVRGVGFDLDEGDILALVGANGAGKTTLLRTIAGAHRAAAGTVTFADQNVTALPAHRRVALGMSLVPEGRRLFPTMTVRENLMVGGSSGRKGPWTLDRVADAFPQLKPLLHMKAGNLSGGQQQATAIGRALMANPKVLVLDEVSLGLSPKAVEGVYESLASLITSGVTIILVEQDLNRSLRFATRVACMLEGRIVAEGLSSSMSREEVMEHYFGRRQAKPASISEVHA